MSNPTIVDAFKAALVHQGLIVLLLIVLLALAWRALRLVELRQAQARLAAATPQIPVEASADGPDSLPAGSVSLPAGPPAAGVADLVDLPEPAARRLLRIAFGLLWIFDGILQAQPDMPLGMTASVLQPSASSSPTWVQHVANAGATIWTYHPISVSVSAVWIQVGIGLLLLLAPRGRWSRLAGAASIGWGLVVWVFGEAFGQILSPGQSFLFGTPGAVLVYVVAGALVALPERLFDGPRLGRFLCRGIGLYLLGMALLQAWPGRGFWQGRLLHGRQPDGSRLGTLADMSRQMAETRQPHLFSSWVSAFSSFDAAHGFAVNCVVVLLLALLGAAFLTARAGILRYALPTAAVFCLADWILVQDLGFFGGLGTDPNTMIPTILLLGASTLAVGSVPATAFATHGEAPGAEAPAAAGATVARQVRLSSWVRGLSRRPTYLLRSLAALGACGVVLLGVMPMAFASLDPVADPIIAQATDGSPDLTNFPAPDFRLVDQHGAVVSLAGLRGRTVALTFLDPVCTSDCPIIAQEFRQAYAMLSPATRARVELVAVDANPLYRSTAYLAAFDRQEGLDHQPDWLYLTGGLAQLNRTWGHYGVQVAYSPGGAMIAHTDLAYVIDPAGHVRTVLDADPGPGTNASKSSFAATLSQAIRRAAAGS